MHQLIVIHSKMLLLGYLRDLVMLVVSLVRLILQVLDFGHIVNRIFIIIAVVVISKLLDVFFALIVVVELSVQLDVVNHEAEVVVVVAVCRSLLLVHEASCIHGEGAQLLLLEDWYLLAAFVMLGEHVWQEVSEVLVTCSIHLLVRDPMLLIDLSSVPFLTALDLSQALL